jgi:hypothetical protein
LEKDYDYVQISISKNNGATWIPLDGKYTNPGSLNQAYNQPLYDGIATTWVREAISLNEYMGQKVKFRFRLKADQGTEFDGYYFDDFNISMLLDPTSTPEIHSKGVYLGIPYPNPADDKFEVSYSLPSSPTQSELVLTTPAGITVSRTRLSLQSGNAEINTRLLNPGVYFISIKSAQSQSPVRKVVVK